MMAPTQIFYQKTTAITTAMNDTNGYGIHIILVIESSSNFFSYERFIIYNINCISNKSLDII